MSVKKVPLRRATRAVGSRFNMYSNEEDKRGGSDLKETIETIADKVDTATGRVDTSDNTGSTGAFRVVKQKNLWYVEIKSGDGWIRSDNTSVSGFKLKDKSV